MVITPYSKKRGLNYLETETSQLVWRYIKLGSGTKSGITQIPLGKVNIVLSQNI